MISLGSTYRLYNYTNDRWFSWLPELDELLEAAREIGGLLGLIDQLSTEKPGQPITLDI